MFCTIAGKAQVVQKCRGDGVAKLKIRPRWAEDGARKGRKMVQKSVCAMQFLCCGLNKANRTEVEEMLDRFSTEMAQMLQEIDAKCFAP